MSVFKKIPKLWGLVGALLITASAAFAGETAPGIDDLGKPFNQYTWVTAHNGYVDDMRTQLERGVRGFMLDLHPGNLSGEADVYLCHAGETGRCNVRNDRMLVDVLNDVFLPFLRSSPEVVVTLLLENYVDRINLQDALSRVPGLADWVFDPSPYAEDPTWPTLAQIIASGRRLVILTDRSAGAYEIDGKTLHLLQDKQWENQNYWDLGITILEHEWSCPSRWEQYDAHVWASGFGHWPRLFVMNQFHTWGATADHAAALDNNLTWLERRVDNHCAVAMGKRTAPNFLAINFNQAGDAFSYAAALTQGGFYFYEANQASPAGDTTCVIPAGQSQSLRLPARGCENDEARSMKLRGISAGTRVMVYDSPGGSITDDYAVIDIKRDIGLDEAITVSTFERNEDNADFRLVYVRENGLDGKISRIVIGETPLDSDANDMQ